MKLNSQPKASPEDNGHLEGHSEKCTQVLSSGEGHSQLTLWDPRPCYQNQTRNPDQFPVRQTHNA